MNQASTAGYGQLPQDMGRKPLVLASESPPDPRVWGWRGGGGGRVLAGHAAASGPPPPVYMAAEGASAQKASAGALSH